MQNDWINACLGFLASIVIFAAVPAHARITHFPSHEQFETSDIRGDKDFLPDHPGGKPCTDCCLSAGDTESEQRDCLTHFGCDCGEVTSPFGCGSEAALMMSGVKRAEAAPVLKQIVEMRRVIVDVTRSKSLDRLYEKHRVRLGTLVVLNKDLRYKLARFVADHQDAIAAFSEGKGVVGASGLADYRALLIAIARADRGALAKDLQTTLLPALQKSMVGKPFQHAIRGYVSRAFP